MSKPFGWGKVGARLSTGEAVLLWSASGSDSVRLPHASTDLGEWTAEATLKYKSASGVKKLLKSLHERGSASEQASAASGSAINPLLISRPVTRSWRLTPSYPGPDGRPLQAQLEFDELNSLVGVWYHREGTDPPVITNTSMVFSRTSAEAWWGSFIEPDGSVQLVDFKPTLGEAGAWMDGNTAIVLHGTCHLWAMPKPAVRDSDSIPGDS